MFIKHNHRNCFFGYGIKYLVVFREGGFEKTIEGDCIILPQIIPGFMFTKLSVGSPAGNKLD